MSKSNLKQQNRINIAFAVSLFFYGAACLYLYYMQSIQPLDYNNRFFMSDLPYHISMVWDDGWYYSFTAYVYVICMKLAGGRTGLIALFLAIVSVVTVILTEILTRQLFRSPKRSVASVAGAFVLTFVMPFFLRFAGQYRYVSYQSGTVWHNSTYQCMKLFALLCMLLYLHLDESYGERYSWREWGWFVLVLVICTGIKPSFLTVFAPVLAVKLLLDLLSKRASFLQVVWVGLSVIPAGLVVLWQNSVLFGEDTGNGFTISPWETFSLHADRPKLAVLCSVAFPLCVLGSVLLLRCLYCIKQKISVKSIFQNVRGMYLFAWGMAFVGFMEALLLVETGARSRDGNFLWGYGFALAYLYIVSLCKWEEMRVSGENTQYRRLSLVLYLLCAVVLVYQVYCGLYFFEQLLMGNTYFMMG